MRSVEIDRFSVPVETRAPTGQTNAYLIQEVETDETVLIDPAGRIDALDAAVAEQSVAHIAVTHSHPDHVGAVLAYGMQSTADIWSVHTHETRLAEAIGVYPAQTFRDGDQIGPVTAIATPGHAADHVAFEIKTQDGDHALICGDLAIEPGSIFVGGADGDMNAYLNSLRLLRNREPDVLYPGHGDPITEPVKTIDRLIQHRHEREARVHAAIKTGSTSPDTILEAAYDKDLTGVRDLARLTVIAHIEKLAAESKIEWNPDTEYVTRTE